MSHKTFDAGQRPDGPLFPDLQRALHAWVHDAIGQISVDNVFRNMAEESPGWTSDHEGTFHYGEQVLTWSESFVESLRELSSWAPVMDAFHCDDRLNRHLDTLVGTAAHGTVEFDALRAAARVLPAPLEMKRIDSVFAERYSLLESLLSSDDVGFTTIWPIPGLVVSRLPRELDSQLELDAMTNDELAIALQTERLRPSDVRDGALIPRPEHRTCLRYRYRLPKIIGSAEATRQAQEASEVEARLDRIRAALDESIAPALPFPVITTGQITFETDRWPTGQILFQDTGLQSARSRIVEMTDEEVTDFLGVWRFVWGTRLLQQHTGLALAMRRLSYQAQRGRPEDELLDLMIAAEALYLGDLGNANYRGELRYRLALRAALWTGSEPYDLERRDTFTVMRSAYDLRSAVAHGGRPDLSAIKLGDQRVSVAMLVAVVRHVLTRGCRRALAEAEEQRWPPDWDELALGCSHTTEA